MNGSNLTLVTALFDIGRGEMGTSFSRSFEHYKECFSRLLKLDFNLLIYCEPELNDFVWSYRKNHNTTIINKTLQDLRKFPFFDKVQEIRKNPFWINQSGWIADSTQARLELYNPLVMSKQFFLNDATHYNPFNTDYFLWIDAGISNTVNIEGYLNSTFEKKITKHLQKMLYLCFPYDGTVEVHGFAKQKMNQYAGVDTKFVARGGVFGGSKSVINEINDIYYGLLESSLSSGFMGTEESIFTIIAYKHKDKCNIQMIEANGLVYKFFDNLSKELLPKVDSPLAIYVLTYNFPKQLELWIDSFKKAYPKQFQNLKKYVIDNSNDPSVISEYDRLYDENDIEVIHRGENLGINDGRHIAAEHFAISDHDYMIFFEDDMLMHDGSQKVCKCGFPTFDSKLFEKITKILDNNKLDYLKLSFSEFYGDNHDDWSWHNVPEAKKKEYFPDITTRPKVKIAYTGTLEGLPFSVGNYHFCNWPLLFNKEGNKKIFLDVQYEHKYEQTIMSHVRNLIEEKKIKPGVLLLSPINHNRICHYPREKRRENKHWTN